MYQQLQIYIYIYIYIIQTVWGKNRATQFGLGLYLKQLIYKRWIFGLKIKKYKKSLSKEKEL